MKNTTNPDAVEKIMDNPFFQKEIVEPIKDDLKVSDNDVCGYLETLSLMKCVQKQVVFVYSFDKKDEVEQEENLVNYMQEALHNLDYWVEDRNKVIGLEYILMTLREFRKKLLESKIIPYGISEDGSFSHKDLEYKSKAKKGLKRLFQMKDSDYELRPLLPIVPVQITDDSEISFPEIQDSEYSFTELDMTKLSAEELNNIKMIRFFEKVINQVSELKQKYSKRIDEFNKRRAELISPITDQSEL